MTTTTTKRCPGCQMEHQGLCRLHVEAPKMAEAIAWLLPLASAYLRSAPSHPDWAKLETARALLARLG